MDYDKIIAEIKIWQLREKEMMQLIKSQNATIEKLKFKNKQLEIELMKHTVPDQKAPWED